MRLLCVCTVVVPCVSKTIGVQAVSLLARVGAFRNDGANGTLPVLNPAELHQLQVGSFAFFLGS